MSAESSGLNPSKQTGSSKRAYSFAGGYGTIFGLTLPAAGERDGSYGGADYRGSYGNYWSSSVNGSKARYLCIFQNGVYMYSDDRANGYSVRCVQE